MIYTISFILIIVGFALSADFKAKTVADDLMYLLKPRSTLRERSGIEKLKTTKNKNRRGLLFGRLYDYFLSVNSALELCGKPGLFPYLLLLSIILFFAGIALSMLADNVFLAPAAAPALGSIPLLYAENKRRIYTKQLKAELETTLSVLSSSYLRLNSFQQAVSESLPYIKPPLSVHFNQYLKESRYLESSDTAAIKKLMSAINEPVFREWCTQVIRAQSDSTLKDSLPAIVDKLSDERRINSEISGVLAQARSQYYTMAAMLIGSFPLIRLLNKEWFRSLVYTVPGKLVTGLSCAVLFFSFLRMRKITSPVGYPGN